MSAQLAPGRMTTEAFLAWVDARQDDGRYELEDGLVTAMAPERLVHARAKAAAFLALKDAVAAAGLPCETFVEGPGVRIDEATSYQPDVLLQCGERLPGEARFVERPVVIVEVLSPSTAYRDLGRKARAYFRLPSVGHYLIVDAEERVVTHKWRAEGDLVLSADLTGGDIRLDPPGLVLPVAALLPAASERKDLP